MPTTLRGETLSLEYFMNAGFFLKPNPVRLGDEEKAVRKARNGREIASVARVGHGVGSLMGRDSVLSRERALATPWGWADEFDMP